MVVVLNLELRLAFALKGGSGVLKMILGLKMWVGVEAERLLKLIWG